jgi:hypothetical protein
MAREDQAAEEGVEVAEQLAGLAPDIISILQSLHCGTNAAPLSSAASGRGGTEAPRGWRLAGLAQFWF